MNSIFLVKSPLQLINAVEAKHYFGLADTDCVLIVMGDRKSYTQLVNLANVNHQWGRVIPINRVGLFVGDVVSSCARDSNDLAGSRDTLLRSSFFTIRRLNRIAKYMKNVQNIFIGDYDYIYMRHFVNSVNHNKTILLDDGTATVDVAKRRYESAENGAVLRVSKRIKIAAKKILMGLKDSAPVSLCFFTAYDVEAGKDDEFVSNDFQYLRSVSQTLKEVDDIYFLGSPLSEVGFLEEQSYLHQLKMVKNYYPDNTIIYVAHRRENKNKLEQIENELKIKVCLFDYPVEYQIAIIGPKPRQIISFFTSALENMRLIMGDKLKIVSFRLVEGSYKSNEKIDAIYQYYSTNLGENFCVEQLVDS